MISFDHGEIRKSDERELAGMIAHAVLPVTASQAFTFLTQTRSLTIPEWQSVLDRIARDPERDEQMRAIRRLRDVLRDAPADLLALMDRMNARADAISREVHVFVHAPVTVASYALLLREQVGEADAARLYAPFDPFIPLASLA